eukprot:1337564-Pleurochrysis_carterae.AAC.2
MSASPAHSFAPIAAVSSMCLYWWMTTPDSSLHLLRNKGKAPAAVREFIASFTAALNRKKINQ